MKPSDMLYQVNHDNFMREIKKENRGFDPVEINKYTRLSSQIRNYVAHDLFEHFRGLNSGLGRNGGGGSKSGLGENRGCHDRSSGCEAFAGLEHIWGYGWFENRVLGNLDHENTV